MNSNHVRINHLAFALLIGAGLAAGAEPLEWKACVREALKKNNELKSSYEGVRQSEASLESARSAERVKISGSVSASEAKQYMQERGDSYSYGLSANRLLYDFGRTGADIGQSEAQLTIAGLKYQSKSADVRRRLRLAYVALLRAQQYVGLMDGILRRREQSTRLIRLRYDAGREHKGSLLTAEAREAQAKLDKAVAERALLQAQKQLAYMMGWPDESTVAVSGSLEPGAMGKDSPEFGKLAAATPQWRQLAIQADSAQLAVKSAGADMLPSLSGRAGISRGDDEWPAGRESWSASLTLDVPIYEGGRLLAQKRKTDAALRAAEADEASGRSSLLVDLKSKWNDFVNSVDSLAVRKKFLDATAERSKISEVQYATGLVGFDSWIIIEDEYVDAQKAFIDGQAGVLNAEAAWIYAKGGTLENEND